MILLSVYTGLTYMLYVILKHECSAGLRQQVDYDRPHNVIVHEV
jgi:hypothetical protein